MSDPAGTRAASTASTLPARLLPALPVLAALNVLAIAHQRLLFALPLELVLAFALLTDAKVRHSSRGLLATGAALALAGLGLQLTGAFPELPPRPFPPLVLGPLTALLSGLAVYCALSRSSLYAWTYAWLLAVVCATRSGSAALYASLALLGLSMLAAAFAQGRIFRQGLAGVVAVGSFALVAAGATDGLSSATRASEGLLMDALGRYLREGFRSGVGMESTLRVSGLSSVELSQRPIFEIAGALPRRLRTAVFERFEWSVWSESGGEPRRSNSGSRPGPP